MRIALTKGTTLQKGKYTIVKTLGQGSFGITYLATTRLTMMGNLGQMEMKAKVAIKEFFLKEMNSRSEDGSSIEGSGGGLFANYRQKFKKEAENLSKMDHPNIVKVSDIFDENNTTYYVMQYIDGQSLDDYISQQGRIKENEAVSILMAIGNAVQYMHSRKMLHLDLKPRNVMMDNEGKIYLIDFGLSKQYDSSGEPESSTNVGGGTPGYAPIEQLNYQGGEGFPVTMDVYALGATMFKMLTGLRAPAASDILNDGFPLNELQECRITDLTTASVVKAMSPGKKDRYQTVEDFLNAFEEKATIIDADETGETTEGKQQDITIIPHFDDFLNTSPEKESQKEEEKVVRAEKAKRTLQINSNTSKVRIEYWPYSLIPAQYYGAFISVITPTDVNPNVTQESTREMIPMTQGKFKVFLKALQDLRLEIRDEVEEHTKPTAFTPAKLIISLYDKKGVLYSEHWIDGMNGGNIVGNVDSIEKQIIQIVPGLDDYLNGPFYEVPDLNECWEFKRESSKSETSRPFPKDLNEEDDTISYRWWSILVLAVEIGFAWLMLNQCSAVESDFEGSVICALFCIASLCIFLFLFYIRKKTKAKTWRFLSICFTMACFANSLLLPIWNGSLTSGFFALSLGLSFISTLTILYKKY